MNTIGPLETGGGDEKLTGNPMDQSRIMAPLEHIRTAQRCGARTRAGGVCQCPAIRDRKRCRLHGGRSPGAPRGRDNGNFKDGTFTVEAVEERQWLKSVVRTYAKAQKQ
jgi:hypothetical protein